MFVPILAFGSMMSFFCSPHLWFLQNRGRKLALDDLFIGDELSPGISSRQDSFFLGRKKWNGSLFHRVWMSSFVGILRNILRTVLCSVVETTKEKIHIIFFLRFKLPCTISDAPNTMRVPSACSAYSTALKILANEKNLCFKNGPLMHAFILSWGGGGWSLS